MTRTQTKKLDRREVVRRLVENRSDLLVITSLGSPTYDLAAAGDHERNFYLWGAMGGAIPMGLGLALARPATPVCVIVGDGETLMSLGSFATVAVQDPPNLSIVVLDNGLYGETGGQLSHAATRTDLAAVAKGCGIAQVWKIDRPEDIAAMAARVNRIGEGARVEHVAINADELPRTLPSRDGVFLKNRIRRSLALTCD